METRRLLSLVELLGVFLGEGQLEKTRKMLKRHLDAFDPLRDTQVQLSLLAGIQRQFPEASDFQRALSKRKKKCLEKASRRIERVKLGFMEKVFDRLSGQLENAGENAAQSTRHRIAIMNSVQDAFTRTLTLQRAMEPGAAASIHQTRIAFKTFRYMVESLQPLMPAVTPARLAKMHDYQTMMGEVQDTEVFLDRLDKYAKGHPVRQKSLARLRRWLLVRRTTKITHCFERADRLRQFWPPQTARPSTKAPARSGSAAPWPAR